MIGRRRLAAGLVFALVATLFVAALSVSRSATAAIGEVVELQAETTADRVCHEEIADGAGVASFELAPGPLGYVTARLDATGGDWDLALFDVESGREIAASASAG